MGFVRHLLGATARARARSAMMAIPVQHCTTSQLKKALVARGLPLPTNLEHAHFVQSCVEQGITQLSPSEVAPGRGAGTAAPTGRGGADRKRHYVTVLLVAMWYVTSVVAIVTCKTTLTKVPVPGLLCVVQLATATMLQSTILGTLRARRGLATREPPLALGHEARVVRRVGLSYSLGFALTNFAFSIADASAVETVKSTEPLSTVVLAAVVLSEREHLLTYVSLLPTVLGVAMVTLPPPRPPRPRRLEPLRLAPANALVPARAGLLLRRLAGHDVAAGRPRLQRRLLHPLRPRQAAQARPPHLRLRHLRPASLLPRLARRRARHAALGRRRPVDPRARRLGRGDVRPVLLRRAARKRLGARDVQPALFHRTLARASHPCSPPGRTACCLPVCAPPAASSRSKAPRRVPPPASLPAVHAIAPPAAPPARPPPPQVSTASHAVLNIFRRVVLIVVTVIIFGTPVNALNCAGVALAAAGALLFARSKHSKVSAGGDVNGTVSLKGIMNAAIDRVV